MDTTHQHASRNGMLYGIGAYGLWGLIPLYFQLVAHLAPLEVLAHRVIWSLGLLAVLILLRRRWRQAVDVLRSRRVMYGLAASTVFIAMNWFTYIYAVSTEQVLQASLGYFITPLVNVLLGMAFFRERLRPLQMVGLALAALGVLNLALIGGGVPWIAVSLAFSFSLYGLLRKSIAVDSMSGLFVETLLLSPLAIGWLTYLQGAGESTATGYWPLLMLGGLVTTIPLILFTAAARQLKMSTLGFLQYLSPSLQFALAVLVFDEPFSGVQLASFGCIWLAVALYTADSLRSYRRRRNEVSQPLVAPTVRLQTCEAD